MFDDDPRAIVVGMRTAQVPTPTAHATSRRHLRLVAAAPRRVRVGGPQRVAAGAAGLVCGFVLAAWATVIGGGSPAGMLAAASLAGAVLFLALVACRASVRRRARATARSRRTTQVRVTPSAPAGNVVPLRRAA